MSGPNRFHFPIRSWIIVLAMLACGASPRFCLAQQKEDAKKTIANLQSMIEDAKSIQVFRLQATPARPFLIDEKTRLTLTMGAARYPEALTNAKSLKALHEQKMAAKQMNPGSVSDEELAVSKALYLMAEEEAKAKSHARRALKDAKHAREALVAMAEAEYQAARINVEIQNAIYRIFVTNARNPGVVSETELAALATLCRVAMEEERVKFHAKRLFVDQSQVKSARFAIADLEARRTCMKADTYKVMLERNLDLRVRSPGAVAKEEIDKSKAIHRSAADEAEFWLKAREEAFADLELEKKTIFHGHVIVRQVAVSEHRQKLMAVLKKSLPGEFVPQLADLKPGYGLRLVKGERTIDLVIGLESRGINIIEANEPVATVTILADNATILGDILRDLTK